MKIVIGRKTETKITPKPQQITLKSKLSIGVCIFSIVFIVCGSIWIYSLLSYILRSQKTGGAISKDEVLLYLVDGMGVGVGMLFGGIGMLRKKYKALRFVQAYLIIGAAFCLVMTMIQFIDSLKLNNFLNNLRFFLLLVTLFGPICLIFGLSLWFLFKKSTVDQFKTHP